MLIGIPLAYFLGAFILARGLPVSRASPAGVVRFYGSSFVLTFLFRGPLFEEPGWRGFAFSIARETRSICWLPLLATFVGSMAPPALLVPDWADQNGGAAAAGTRVFLACTVAFTVIMT